jgi:hypothetical protein
VAHPVLPGTQLGLQLRQWKRLQIIGIPQILSARWPSRGRPSGACSARTLR